MMRTGAIFIGEWRKRLRLVGDAVPTVDVFIPTCNEEIGIMDTIQAALNIDYPGSRFRVIVADDGDTAELRTKITFLKDMENKQNIYYTTRGKGFRSERSPKAANLNHAMQFACNLPNGPSEYAAGVDADMIPERHWLRTTVAVMINDPEIGYVYSPAVRSIQKLTNILLSCF